MGGNSGKSLTKRTQSENPIIRATIDIGHVAGRLFVCIGLVVGPWFIGIRRMP
jgi:hypothetical protein